MVRGDWLGAWLPSSRSTRRLIVASFVDSVGTGMFLAGSALFFTRVLGLSTVQVGLGLSLAGLAGFLGVVPIGRLADRMGGKRIIVLLYLWRGTCFAFYPFVRGPTVFFIVACLIGVAEWGGAPVVQGIVGAVQAADSRVRTMAVIASVRNVGFTVGAVLATLAVATRSTRAFSGVVFADAATFFGAAVLLSRLPAAAGAAAVRQQLSRSAVRVRDPRFLALTVLNGVLYLHSILLTVVLPLWIVTRTTAPPAMIGAVVVINTVMAIVLQIPLSGGSADIRSAAKRQQWAGWCLAGCCLLAALAARAASVAAIALLVAAATALTLGEIWQSVGAWRLSYALSPEHQRAYYLSVYQLGKSGATAVGPALLTWATIRNGTFGWTGLAAFFALTGLAVVLITAGLAGPRATADASPGPLSDAKPG